MSLESGVTRKWEKVERTVGAVVISIFMFLVFFSLVDQMWGSLWQRNNAEQPHLKKDAYFEPRPFVAYGGSRDQSQQKSEGLNALGYRGPVPAVPKPSLEYRIIFIGGSTVLYGSPSISELVENHFHEAGLTSVRVYNFGVAASTLRMDLARFFFEASDYEPDLVVFYGGGNDIGMPYQSDPRPGYPPNFLSYEHNPLLLAGTKNQSFLALFKLALFHSQLLSTLLGERLRASLVPLEATRVSAGWMSVDWSNQIASTYLSDISRAEKSTRAFGAKAFVIFQPILAFKKSRTLTEEALLNSEFITHANRCRNVISAGLLDLHNRQGVMYADISTIFDPLNVDVFYDGIHIRQEFYPLVSKAVFDAIQANTPR